MSQKGPRSKSQLNNLITAWKRFKKDCFKKSLCLEGIIDSSVKSGLIHAIIKFHLVKEKGLLSLRISKIVLKTSKAT